MTLFVPPHNVSAVDQVLSRLADPRFNAVTLGDTSQAVTGSGAITVVKYAGAVRNEVRLSPSGASFGIDFWNSGTGLTASIVLDGTLSQFYTPLRFNSTLAMYGIMTVYSRLMINEAMDLNTTAAIPALGLFNTLWAKLVSPGVAELWLGTRQVGIPFTAGISAGQLMVWDTVSGGIVPRLSTLSALEDLSVTSATISSAVNCTALLPGPFHVMGGGTIEIDLRVKGALYVTGKATIDGLLDPTGLQCPTQLVNPGDANTLWFSGSSVLRSGSRYNLATAALTVTANTVPTWSTTTPDLIVATPMIVSPTGAVSGVSSVGCSSVAATGAITAGTSISSSLGLILGKQIAGGVWYKVYNMTVNTNDAVAMTVVTKDVDTDEVCRKIFNIGCSLISGTITVRHSIDSGPLVNQPRLTTFFNDAAAPSIEISIAPSTGTSGYLGPMYYWQSFVAVTGRRLASVTLSLELGGGAGGMRVYLFSGVGGRSTIDPSLIAMSSIVSVPDTYVAPDVFPFPVPPTLTLGATYTVMVRHALNYDYMVYLSTAAHTALAGYYDLGVGDTQFPAGTNLLCDITTIGDASQNSYDVYLYGQPEGASRTYVTIDGTNTQPLWTGEGSGVWPTSHPLGTDLSFDSDNTATYPPNMVREQGSLTLHSTTNATALQDGALTVRGGLTVGVDTRVAGSLNVASTAATTLPTNGAAHVAGGLGVEGDIRVGTAIYTPSLTVSSSLTTLGTFSPSSLTLTPVAANPGTSATIWSDLTGGLMQGATPLVHTSDASVTTRTVPVYNGTTGGALSQSLVAISSAGSLSGVSDITAQTMTVSGRVSTAEISSTSGILRGRVINGGVWYLVYTISSNSNDCLQMKLLTKDVDTDLICNRRVNIGTSTFTDTITVQHDITSGATANQPRVVCFDSPIGLFAHAWESESTQNTALLTVVNPLVSKVYQSFVASTGRSLALINLTLSTGGATNLSLELRHGTGTAGILVGTSDIITLVAPATLGIQHFVFTGTLPMALGDTYSAVLRSSMSVTIEVAYGVPGNYIDGIAGYNDGVDHPLAGDLVFAVNTSPTGAHSYDVYVYGQPEPASRTYVTIEGCGTRPFWDYDGTGVWPSSYPAGTSIAFDTSDPVTYPPNLPYTTGKLIVSDTTAATSTDGSIVTSGGVKCTNLYSTAITAATAGAGAIRSLGGVSGTNFYATDITAGGVGVGAIYSAGGIGVGTVQVASDTSASIYSAGGVRCTNIYAASATTATSTAGTIYSVGGIRCFNLYSTSTAAANSINAAIYTTGGITSNLGTVATSTTGDIYLAGGIRCLNVYSASTTAATSGAGAIYTAGGISSALATVASNTTGGIYLAGGVRCSNIYSASTTAAVAGGGAIFTSGGVSMNSGYCVNNISSDTVTCRTSMTSPLITIPGGMTQNISQHFAVSGTLNAPSQTTGTCYTIPVYPAGVERVIHLAIRTTVWQMNGGPAGTGTGSCTATQYASAASVKYSVFTIIYNGIGAGYTASSWTFVADVPLAGNLSIRITVPATKLWCWMADVDMITTYYQ